MKYQLAIDRGNSFTKLSVFDGQRIHDIESHTDSDLQQALSSISSRYHIAQTIFSDVRDGYSNSAITELLPTPHLNVSHKLLFPFVIQYITPETIGHDRLANIAGACYLRPKKNVLVIDFGTCTTYSLLIAEAFIGGAISPGRLLRFKSLHDYTGRLPLVTPSDFLPTPIGNSTTASIRAGVEHAILAETQGMIEAYQARFNDLEVLITGGDYTFFENSLKSATFAEPQLTQIGLHEILRTNSH